VLLLGRGPWRAVLPYPLVRYFLRGERLWQPDSPSGSGRQVLGVPAAFVMSATCALLGGVAAASGSSPGEVLARINEAVLTRIPPNMFVTCFYAILEPKSGTLRYANAGHDLPYLWHGGDAEELRARGMPLGLMPEMGYEEKEIKLDAGEGVLFYSDGLEEAHDPEGEMFGFPGYVSWLPSTVRSDRWRRHS
jgi:serine phosphatase RsbU (regulator of sigma subunit)